MEVTITYKDHPILSGNRKTNGLWNLNLFPIQEANAAVGNNAKTADLVAFHHASLFSPSISTLQKALQKGYLPLFPGLTKRSLKKYPPTLAATIKGHLNTVRINTKSTRTDDTYPSNIVAELMDDFFPGPILNGQ